MEWKDEDDGTFCMAVEDFSHYFAEVTICRVHDNYVSQGLHFNQEEDNYSFFSL